MLGVTLFARLLLFLWQCFLVRFDEGCGGRFQLLQFLYAHVRPHQLLIECVIFGPHGAQLLLILAFPFPSLAQLLHHLTDPLQYPTEFLFQLCDLFFLRHGLSIADKVFCEQYQPPIQEPVSCYTGMTSQTKAH